MSQDYPAASEKTSGRRIIVCVVTLPTAPVTLASLIGAQVIASGEQLANIIGWSIGIYLSDKATKRGPTAIGDTVATCVSAYAQDAIVSPPVADVLCFVGSASGSAITGAVIDVHCIFAYATTPSRFFILQRYPPLPARMTVGTPTQILPRG